MLEPFIILANVSKLIFFIMIGISFSNILSVLFEGGSVFLCSYLLVHLLLLSVMIWGRGANLCQHSPPIFHTMVF